MSHYAAGANFERKVRDKLYADGAKLVVRSAGSKGPVDLVALYPTHRDVPPSPNATYTRNRSGAMYRWRDARAPRFVQVKRGRGMTKAKREALVDLAKMCGAWAVLAYPEKVGRRVEVRLEVL